MTGTRDYIELPLLFHKGTRSSDGQKHDYCVSSGFVKDSGGESEERGLRDWVPALGQIQQ